MKLYYCFDIFSVRYVYLCPEVKRKIKLRSAWHFYRHNLQLFVIQPKDAVD